MTDNEFVFIPFCGDATVTDTLLIAPGDRLRWLVAPCPGIKPGDSLKLISSAGVETSVGTLRRPRGESYTDLVLAVGSVPTNYRQFALEVDGQPITTTFYPDVSGYADRLAYTRAITRHLANQPFIAVDVYRSGYVIYLRIYDGERINLTGQTVTVGLGKVITPNSNVPVLRVTKSTPISYAASWPYRVSIGASIEAGNVFRLDGVSYTAQAGDTVANVRTGLGLSLDESVPISRSTATYPTATAEAGTGRIVGSNNPTLALQYSGTSGGNDTYLVVVGSDIVAGNVYQIQVPGSADRITVATSSSTVSSIATALVSGGVLSVTAGLTPVALTDVGYQTATNTNQPSLTLTALTPLPARTLDRYTGFVGSDIVTGNRYELSIAGVVSSYTAQAGDTATIVAKALGRSGSSFTVEVATGGVVFARSFRGNAYRGPDHVAPIALTQKERPLGGPWIAELVIPMGTTGTYKLACGSVRSSVRLSVGNAYVLQSDTSLVRWSTSEAEDNLTCQLRLPVCLSVDRLQQSETSYVDLSGLQRRNRATGRKSSVLTTASQSAQFHRAMWALLKSDTITIDGADWQQQGEYSTTDGTPPNYRGQGRCTLLATRQAETRALWAGTSISASTNYASISWLIGANGLSLWVKGYSFEGELREGLQFPAGEYQLRIVTGADPLTLRIDRASGETALYTLWPQTTNRLRNVRFEPGVNRVAIATIASALLTTSATTAYSEPEAVLLDVPETVIISDFNDDFNSDFQ
ncbi:hypothetical protein [Fibrivirga algicola]|uniref:Uncharacterized protein n=1 Tax=Fibrivirga algicola TaxID=2950420 RepID=A0ABX0QBC0_9BACT|nr:hypothetical protein [Fibrivirga algicola]NID09379.1 hypothetical protein [Fibrivirga algicola]